VRGVGTGFYIKQLSQLFFVLGVAFVNTILRQIIKPVSEWGLKISYLKATFVYERNFVGRYTV
jgi:hypothetical protein